MVWNLNAHTRPAVHIFSRTSLFFMLHTKIMEPRMELK